MDTSTPAPLVSLTNDTSHGKYITSDGRLTVTDTEAGDTFRYSTNGGRTWTSTPAYAGDGPQTVLVKATDAAGNTNTSTFNFTLDTHAPADTVKETITLGTGTSPSVALSGTATDSYGVASVKVNGATS